jgi:hypothetical protein
MANNLGVVEQLPKSSNSASAITANYGNESNIPALELAQNPALDARCLWCDRTFSSRTTGGSAEVLLQGTQATVLDRGASLDDEGD